MECACGARRVDTKKERPWNEYASGSSYHDWVEAHGYGPHYVGIMVEDMGAALAEAREAGLAVIQEGTGFGFDGDGHFAYLDTEDALGMALELIEVPKRRVAPDKIYPPPQDQEGKV